MLRLQKVLRLIAALGLLASVSARPIRVAVLEVIDPGGYLHSSIHDGTPYFIALLNNPATATPSLTNSVLGTGQPPLIPPDGFKIDTIGNGGTGTSGGGATAANVAKLISLLDSVDVLVEQNSLGFGGIVTAASDRAKFLKFADTKGIVALHSAADNHSSSSSAPTWASYDSLTAVMFLNHVVGYSDELKDTVALDTLDTANFTPLQAGLISKYWFYEELYSMTANPRPIAGIRVLTTLNEKSFTVPPTTAWGDHPYSWYRRALSGNTGRWFYTCEGHIDSLYQNNYSFRRQFYNAVVWAAGYTGGVYNGVGAASIEKGATSFANVSKTSIVGGALTVSFLQEGSHSVEIRSLDGKLIASDKGMGQSRTFNLRPNSVYALFVSTAQGHQNKLVTTQP